MISFSLKCENNHQFEGWFRSSVDYEDQVKKGLISCPNCNNKKISKALLRTLHRRRRILSERSNQGSFDQSYEDDFNWEEIAEEDPESFQAQLRCMTSTSLFKQLETRMSDMFMHHKSDVLSGGENEDFLIATTCDDVEVNDVSILFVH